MSEKVIISSDIRSAIIDFLEQKPYSQIGILADNNTSRHCLPIILDLIPSPTLIRIPAGEQHKNLITCELIWKELTTAGFDRKSLLINLGGGVIGDMGGFCASTFKRGIDFINIPTTLLAQVDASVGGKVGIDFNGLKNHIGLFTLPGAVLIDDIFLKTLPERELRSGFAEVIKHSLIKDKDYWLKIIGYTFNNQPWKEHIEHSVQIKSGIVENDPFEKGLRKILNFGHTIGHAIESYFLNSGKDTVLHGEAVAAGMICELILSKDLIGLNSEDADTAIQYLKDVFGKLKIAEKEAGLITGLTLQDKKNVDGELRFSLLQNIGETRFNIPVSPKQAEQALVRYCKL
jgi:3-dehydroquinate synthase